MSAPAEDESAKDRGRRLRIPFRRPDASGETGGGETGSGDLASGDLASGDLASGDLASGDLASDDSGGGPKGRLARIGKAMGGLVLVVGGAGLVSADAGAGRVGTTVVGQASADVAAATTTVAPDPTTSTSTTTTEETTTTVSTDPPRPADPSVAGLQRRLAELGYDVGDPDGGFGWRTYYSVMAFQKVEGLERTGADGPDVRAALARASRPGPIVPGGEPTRVEIDLERQVLFLWRDGQLARILSVSTGSGQRYCVDGDCDVAVTPTGAFRIGRKYPGMEVSRLGQLFHPMYFYGGIAIHGSPSVPAHPASHGCVRVPMYAAASLYDQVPAGTPVHVVGDAPSAAAVAPPPDDPVRPADQTPPPEPAEPPPTQPAATTPPTTVSDPAPSITAPPS